MLQEVRKMLLRRNVVNALYSISVSRTRIYNPGTVRSTQLSMSKPGRELDAIRSVGDLIDTLLEGMNIRCC